MDLYQMNEHGVITHTLVDGEYVEHDATEVAVQTLGARKHLLKLIMNGSIISKGQEMTGGNTKESIQAFVSAYQLRANNASEYVAEGLTVGYAVTGYTVGDALDTDIKINEYYTKVLIEMDKFRNAEIVIYLTAKAAL